LVQNENSPEGEATCNSPVVECAMRVNNTADTEPLVKRLIQGLFVMLAMPLVLAVRLLARLGNEDIALAGCSQLLSLLPGKSGSYYRAACYRYLLSHCSQNVYIGFGTLFSQCATEVNDGVYIGPQCNIGSARIGRDCLLGSGVHLLSGKGQHRFDSLEVPIRDQGGRIAQISIGKNTWIGNGSLVMADVGEHSVIGAGSVVIDAIPPKSIAAGNPARVIRSRT